MNEEPTRGRQLGRGLSALFGEEAEEYVEPDPIRQAKLVPIGGKLRILAMEGWSLQDQANAA